MSFDAIKVKNDIVKWIRDWFEINGKGCKGVVGVSGGKDSSVVAALLVEALGKENVVGVLMPKGEQFDIDANEMTVSVRVPTDEQQVESVYVALTGAAIWKDSHAIEEYIREAFGCQGTVYIS